MSNLDRYPVTKAMKEGIETAYAAGYENRLSKLWSAVDEFLQYFEKHPMDLCWDDDVTKKLRAAADWYQEDIRK